MRVEKENAIQCYKVFKSDWTCRDFQYEVGKDTTLKVILASVSGASMLVKNFQTAFTITSSTQEIRLQS